MKIRELIEHLLKDNDLDDEIIVDWYSKDTLTDWFDSGEHNHTKEEFDKAWLSIQVRGQEEMSESLSHYGVIYEIRNLVLDEIQEMRKENA
jgi:hypothetical protein